MRLLDDRCAFLDRVRNLARISLSRYIELAQQSAVVEMFEQAVVDFSSDCIIDDEVDCSSESDDDYKCAVLIRPKLFL